MLPFDRICTVGLRARLYQKSFILQKSSCSYLLVIKASSDMINYIDKLLYNEMLFSESELFRTSLGVSFLFKLIENSFFEEL